MEIIFEITIYGYKDFGEAPTVAQMLTRYQRLLTGCLNSCDERMKAFLHQ